MSDIIHLLPDSVANQIAAGEVIQRPASVIKELVENAIDAGATNISIVVTDAGKTSIMVLDNGKGMSETDSRLSFERHATSKIRSASDLFALQTMGFRGEALASIAAVAQVTLKTRMADEDLGTEIHISASKVTSQEPVSCPVGSSFLIENLFFNIPARRRFLKSNTTELNNIMQAFVRIALVNPDIAFTVHSNGSEVYDLRKTGLRQRITAIMGQRTDAELLPLGVDTSLVKLHGFIGKPETAKRKNNNQFFFVNNRYMRHPLFHKAVMNAYERMIPEGTQVSYFIYLEVDPSEIDVNIHPVKTEIKFDNEQAIFQIIMAAVKEALGKFCEVPSIDFDTEGKPDIPVYDANNHAQQPQLRYNPSYNPFHSHRERHSSQDSLPPEWEQLYKGIGVSAQPDITIRQETDSAFLFPDDSALRQRQNSEEPNSLIEDKSPTHYQYKGRYIMTAVKSGLMIIDQHRAHVRILYEQYLERINSHSDYSQQLLFPEEVECPPADKLILRQIAPQLSEMGFSLNFSDSSVLTISAIPAGIMGLSLPSLITEMIETVRQQETPVSEDLYRSLALTLAQNAASPVGQVMNNEEMENIVNRLFACSNPKYTPDGKTIISILSQEDIEHLFK